MKNWHDTAARVVLVDYSSRYGIGTSRCDHGNKPKESIYMAERFAVAVNFQVTMNTVNATLFIYSYCHMFRFSFERSFCNIHRISTKIIAPTSDPLFWL
jgi:hypothetical protein